VSATAVFVDDHLLRIGATEFHCSFPFGDAPAGRLEVMKNRALVDSYLDLCLDLQPKRIFELGIKRGGSTALISELTQPEKLVAVDLEPQPVDLLEHYIRERQLEPVVRPFYGVNQADRGRLAAIVADEFGDDLIDLVIDDASHLYAETLSSFESLFPHVRPGGLFLIEDWQWQHRLSDAFARRLQEETTEAEELRAELEARLIERERSHQKGPVPLTRLVIELLLAKASNLDVVREFTVGPHWVVVQRGESPIEPATFRLSELYFDHLGLLAHE
jgi:predicted O-methyltransferase YrrM